MRFVVRWLFRFLIVALVLAAILVATKDLLLREVAEFHFRRETGLETRIGQLNLALLSPTVTLQDLRLFNPPEFGGGVFLHFAEIHAEYTPRALLQGHLHLPLLRVHLADATLIQATNGLTNFEAIRQQLAARVAQPHQPEIPVTGVDTLNLSLDQIAYLSLTEPNSPLVLPIGIRQRIYRNLNDLEDVYLALGNLALEVAWRQITNQPGRLPPLLPPSPKPPRR